MKEAPIKDITSAAIYNYKTGEKICDLNVKDVQITMTGSESNIYSGDLSELPVNKWGLPEFETPFLDSNTRCNGKTYYYKKLMLRHYIPLVVNSDYIRKELLKTCIVNGIQINFIYNIHSEIEMRYLRSIALKHICILDCPELLKEPNIKYIEELIITDDEIRDIVLTDLSQGIEY
jgi:hypothetical protein